MGLFDFLRRPEPRLPAWETDVLRRLGRLEANDETMLLQWTAYRDEIKRLVARLEKRDQRAAEREERDARVGDVGVPEAVDAITAKIQARRRGMNGLSE